MPYLTQDPLPSDVLDATTRQNNLDPPATPTPSPTPVGTPNPNPPTPPGPSRTLGQGQTFTPFVAKNLKDEGDVGLINAVNDLLAKGGKLSDLPPDVLTGVTEAAQGLTPNLEDKDVLNDPDKFFQLKFRPGKYQKPLLDDLGNPYTYPRLATEAIGGLVGLVKDAAVGAYQAITHPQDAPAILARGEEATQRLYKILNPFIDVPGMAIAGAGLTAGLQIAQGPAAQRALGPDVSNAIKQTTDWLGMSPTSGASDIAEGVSARLAKLFAGDDATREQVDRDQSEIVRNRMLRDQHSGDLINAAQYKAADTLASLGLNGWANITQKAVVTPEEQALAQIVTDPMTYMEFGAGKTAGATKVGVRFSRLEEAAKTLEETGATADNLATQREAWKGVIRAPNATAQDRIAAERALASQTPLERDAQTAYQTAQSEHQAALASTNQDLTDAAQPSFGRQAVSTLMQGGGQLAEAAGKASDYVATIPSKIVDKLFPTAEENGVKDVIAQSVAQSVKQQVGHYAAQFAAGAIPAGIFGGPIGHVLGGIAGVIAPKGAELLQRVGHDLEMVGSQFALGQQTLPFWKAIAENSTGMTRRAASFLDNQLVYAIPDTARGAAVGAAIGGTIGGIQSGGTTQGVLGGMVPGGVFGAAGAGLGQIHKFNSPAELHAAAIGDRARFLRTLSPQDATEFQKLDPNQQLAFGVYARSQPDVDIKFFTDPSGVNGDHQVVNGRGLIRVNTTATNPFRDVLLHEIGHHVASHGLGADVNAQMLGDVASGRPGVFTKFDANGQPMIAPPDRFGTVSYLPNDEFNAYKTDYNSRLPDGHPPASNYDIAQEMFADLHAARFSDPAEMQKLVRGYVPSGLIGDNAVANWLPRVGVGTDPVTGRSVLTDTVQKTRGLNDLMTNFYRDREHKTNPASDDTGYVKVPVDGTTKGTDEFNRLGVTFDSTNDLKRNPDGSIWTDPSGKPQVVAGAKVDAIHGKLTDDIVAAIKANPQYEAMPGDYIKQVTDRRGRTYYQGQIMQPEVRDILVASSQHNAAQVANIDTLNQAMARNDGTIMTAVYNTPARQGKYTTLPARERAIVPLYYEVDPKTRQTNVLSYDPEQMQTNITKVLRQGQAQKLWDGKIQAVNSDVQTYLGNLANNRPGETGIGLEKKGVLNNLFGLKADANPLIDDVTRKSPSVFKTLRLDRINRLTELSDKMPLGRGTYEQVRAYAQPRGEGGVVRAQPRGGEVVPTRAPEDNSAIPVTYKTTSGGKTEPVAIKSDIAHAPLIADKAPPEKMAKDAPNDFTHLDYLTPIDGQRLTHLNNASAVTDYANKLVDEYGRWTGNRDVMGAKKWYRDVRKYLTQAVGGDAELFAQLLSATSPGQGVVQNWKDAQIAYERFKAGHYDDVIAEFQRTGKITDAMKPRKEGGAKFGQNSDAVLKVLAGTWADTVQDPKTPNFMDNLFGRGTRATIDIWADRTMRRMGYEGVPGAPAQWRITPESKVGVSNLDFGLAQEAYGQAADRLGMDAHELQAVLWYAEKMHWAQKGYAKGGAQAALASYVPQLKAYAAQKVAERALPVKTVPAYRGQLAPR